MRDLLALLAHLMTIVATLLGPGGVKAVVVESLLIKHQLLILNRPRKRVAGSGLPPGSAWNKNRNIVPLTTNWATTAGGAATPWKASIQGNDTVLDHQSRDAKSAHSLHPGLRGCRELCRRRCHHGTNRKNFSARA
jgi:hypothetical protein